MNQDEVEAIAIIGLAGRFPGARNLSEFWANLRDGVESVTFFTDEELADTVNPAWLSNPNYVKANAVLEDADMFDGVFFGFNPRESEVMDPQHRVFLECAWEALEAAGYDSDAYDGAVSVYGGVDLSSYLMNIFSNQEIVASVGALQAIMSNDKDHLCTRVSHKLNLRGPSVCVQSACSTSLTAVHVACRSLLNYECDMALAGGTSIKWPQHAGYMYEEASINSPDGHCRAFDAQAKGTLGGNGVGVVVLKRLSDALQDGDFIHAVIKGTAMNNDGSQKISYTAPSVDGQAEVIAMAQAMAGVDPSTVTYVEAHGTATELGDTIEMAALTKAFRRSTDKVGYCGVGSVKTNIGHLDAAAGIAGLIKTVLALKHKMLPPSLHFKTPNPNIDFASSPFYVNAALSEWEADGPRRAGVSSYGMGGTNVHVILEEFEPDARPRAAAREWQALTLSAKTKTALERMTANLTDYLREHPGADLADIAYTLQRGRKAFAHRRALVCRDVEDALDALEGPGRGRLLEGVSAGGEKSVVMMFSGQGTQHAGMGAGLYRSEQIFRREVDRCAELLRADLGFDLREVLYPEAEQKEEAGRKLQQTFVTQPALFVVEYALARWFESLGVRPQAMIGHSVGEYVAACLSGVFSLEDALRLVAARGRLMQQMPGGSMLAVTLSETDARAWLDERLSLAAVNGPSLCVVSGPDEAVAELEERLTAREVGCRRLHTSHAFHSAMMEPILESFRELFATVQLHAPRVPYMSNVTGAWVTEAEAQSPDYWARHLRETVRFADGARELLRDPHHVMLEIGPGQTLTSLVRQQGSRADAQRVVSSLPAPREEKPDAAFALAALGRLWLAGVAVDWQAVHEGTERRRVYLPTYPFERQRYWIDVARNASPSARPRDAGKQADLADWFYVPVWKQTPPLRASVAEPRRWLLVGEPGGVAGQLARRLAELRQEVVTAAPGEGFARLDDFSYTLDPREAEDYHRLLGDLERRELAPHVVLHFGGLERLEPAASRAELFGRAQEKGFYSLLNLVKALGRSGASESLQLGVFTGGVHDLTGGEESVPEKATVLGLCKVIPQEYPHITCRNIDLAPDEDDDAPLSPGLLDQLLAEMDEGSTELVVAYRGGRAARRWVQAFDPVRLDEPPRPTGLREGGVYLITGGLGGVGMILAEHFARAARARLVLVGRSPFPPKEEWPRWLAEHDAADPTSARIKKLLALEELGGEVTVLSANVADAAAMREVLAEVDRRFGVLHGVVHGAGINGERSVRAISETGRTECGWHFEPKVFGLQTLDEVLRGRELDFCLLLSSLSAVLGGLGFTAYSAANVYMDAFVQQQARAGGLPWVTVDWDGWLLGGEEAAGGVGAAINELSMKPDEGAAAFERILAAPSLTHVVVSTGDLQQRMAQWLRPGATADGAGAENLSGGTLYPRPELSEAYVAPSTSTEQAIADVWRELLGIEQIGVRDNFFELGGHSLLATQLASRMRKLFNVDLPLRRFFETPTVFDLAALVMESQAAQLGLESLAEMAEEIKNISEEELKELLESEKRKLAEEGPRPAA